MSASATHDSSHEPVLLPFVPPAPTRSARVPGEVLLGVLPGATEDRRTAVVRRTGLCGAVSIRLSDESFSPAVGWFPQSSVELPADQLTGLKSLLATVPQAAPVRRPTPVADGAPATLPFAAAG
ncbi:hypothetical protein [Alienimonas californiensis]|uniref:Uncharacterized protein n=1 Tax=Alienimonas californiensis TaxID=2527989 RepID=A0A517P3R8_9PLAN|nr:hypothetical protein [Alienimonas californiensis]QDT14003.1 hypothetical protein CA12_00710 [Alienimonas californiensis]